MSTSAFFFPPAGALPQKTMFHPTTVIKSASPPRSRESNSTTNPSSSPPKDRSKPSLKSKITSKVKKAKSTLTSTDAQTLWPSTLETESHLAALQLRSFFLDCFLSTYSSSQSQVSSKVLREAKGLAVFHILRKDLRYKSVAGTGIVLAKKADGMWSEPSAIAIRETDEEKQAGFEEGVDCIDVLCVINSFGGMKGFSDPSCVLGRDVSISEGPMFESGASKSNESLEMSPKEDARPDAWVYIKGKGRPVDASMLDGMMVVEREEENARFYSEKGVVAKEILGGRILSPALSTNGSERELSRTLEVVAERETGLEGVPLGKSPGDCTVKVRLESTLSSWINGEAQSGL